MTQLNTPYPSTAYLTGFLHSRGFAATQVDLALSLVLELLSSRGLRELAETIESAGRGRGGRKRRAPQTAHFLRHLPAYLATIDPVIGFLQGRDPTLAHRIVSRQFLPEGSRFESLQVFDAGGGEDPLAWAFGALGTQDRARHVATLYLNDLADVLRESVDARFDFVRYGEQLAASQASFESLARALAAPHNLIDATLDRLTRDALQTHTPDLVLISVPFPGAVYGALRIAQTIKSQRPSLPIGFPNRVPKPGSTSAMRPRPPPGKGRPATWPLARTRGSLIPSTAMESA